MTLNKTYIICSTMRSGSTLLCDLLTNTKLVGKPQEFFLKKWEEKSKLYSINYPEYLQKTLELFASSNGVSGVKLMWCTCEEVLQRLRKSNEHTSQSDLELLEQIFPNLQFIFISRRHKLRQAISLARSVKTKQWNKYQDSQNPGKASFNRYGNISNSKKNPYPYISPGSLEIYLAQIQKDESAWFKFFEENNIEPQIMIYEELEQNKQKHIAHLLQFLDVPVSENLKIDSSFQKQADFYTELLILHYRIFTLIKKRVPRWILQILYEIKYRFQKSVSTQKG